MGNSINTVMLGGHLGADPELKHNDHGPLLKLRLATNHTWLDKEKNRQERTSWHNATVFGKRAEAVSKFLKKGMSVSLKGRLETTPYEKNGEKRVYTDIVVEDLCFPGSGGRAFTASDPHVATTDVPF